MFTNTTIFISYITRNFDASNWKQWCLDINIVNDIDKLILRNWIKSTLRKWNWYAQ